MIGVQVSFLTCVHRGGGGWGEFFVGAFLYNFGGGAAGTL